MLYPIHAQAYKILYSKVIDDTEQYESCRPTSILACIRVALPWKQRDNGRPPERPSARRRRQHPRLLSGQCTVDYYWSRPGRKYSSYRYLRMLDDACGRQRKCQMKRAGVVVVACSRRRSFVSHFCRRKFARRFSRCRQMRVSLFRIIDFRLTEH